MEMVLLVGWLLQQEAGRPGTVDMKAGRRRRGSDVKHRDSKLLRKRKESVRARRRSSRSRADLSSTWFMVGCSVLG